MRVIGMIIVGFGCMAILVETIGMIVDLFCIGKESDEVHWDSEDGFK